MATILKRTLFIGLGGTGAAALLNTKKRYLDTYGEIPPMIGFLSIDTDANTQSKQLQRDTVLLDQHKNKKTSVKFDKSELLFSDVRGAMQTYRRKKDTTFNWMPGENEHAIKDMSHGTGQIRSNGRFALHFNYKHIIETVKSKIANLTNIKIHDTNKFKPKGEDIEINFVFSVSGGTGSGTFIDIAYLVKEALGQISKITSIAFVVMPGIFNAMKSGISMKNVRPNGYGALVDLDFLMQKNIGKQKLSLKYESSTINIDTNPFDVVFTVNNKNTASETISDISQVAEQIGLAMFVGSSELSSNINSAYDNVITIMGGGALDVENKRAWAGGMGVSELFYDGNMMGNIYARKAIASMINNLLTANDDAQKLANAFIDDEEVLIRENDGNDYLIDSLLNPSPDLFFPTPDDINDLANSTNTYVENNKEESKSKIENNYALKINKVESELQDFINKYINKSHGISNIREFLSDLNHQLSIFFKEMEEEEEELLIDEKNIKAQVDQNISFLSNLKGFSAILKGRDIKEAKQMHSELLNQLATNNNELLRRQYAKRFLNTFTAKVKEHQDNTENLIQKLKQVKTKSTATANGFYNNANEKTKTFVIDLHKRDLDHIYANEKDYLMSDFVENLPYKNSVYDFYSMGNDLIENHFWEFTKKLDKSLSFKNKSVDDVINEMKESEILEVANQLLNKSYALWQYDMKGYKIGGDIHNDFVIGLPKTESKLKEAFKQIITSQNLSYTATGIENKVVCYRMEVAVPIFAVDDIQGYEKNYKLSKISHHIDANWKLKMDREDFSIWPHEQDDNNLEAWVLGFVYNFIKHDNGVYKIYSEKKGDPLDDFWSDLSPYRDEAFVHFKNDKYANELIERIEMKRRKDGEGATNELIEDVKNNYRAKYAQIDLTNELLKTPPYKNIGELVKKELMFTKNELNL